MKKSLTEFLNDSCELRNDNPCSCYRCKYGKDYFKICDYFKKAIEYVESNNAD